jgi:hypothetical protein
MLQLRIRNVTIPITRFNYLAFTEKKTMSNKSLTSYLSGGIEKHTDGSFTIYGYIENKNGDEVAMHKIRYFDYPISDARKMFKIDLNDLRTLLEENNILTNDAYIRFGHTI